MDHPVLFFSSSFSNDTVIIMMMVKRLINDDFLPKNEELLAFGTEEKWDRQADRHPEYDIRNSAIFFSKSKFEVISLE